MDSRGFGLYMTQSTAHIMRIKLPNNEPHRRVHQISLEDRLAHEGREHFVDCIAADKCRVAAEGSRLSLLSRVELIDYGQIGVIFNQFTHVACRL
jgi:hypothetical protein